MIVRLVLLFLIVMLVLGMIGKWRLPRVSRRKTGTAIEPASKCPTCGTYRVGTAPPTCGREDCPTR